MGTIFFNLRIDEGLNDQIAEIAIEEGRSKNKQIEHILKEYVKRINQMNKDEAINKGRKETKE